MLFLEVGWVGRSGWGGFGTVAGGGMYLMFIPS